MTVTTDASWGAVIGMYDSFTLGGLVPLFNMQTDEVIFGGRSLALIYAIVAVFIGG
jgi:K+-transporting ATPase ATPase A chain